MKEQELHCFIDQVKRGKLSRRRFVEMMVNVGMITSSPGSRSRHPTASWRAVVPLLTAMPCCLPQYAAHFCSNSSMNLPAEEIQPVRTH